MTLWPLSEGPDAALLGLFSATFLMHPPARIAVAVSGGGDSMALLHMAMRAPLGWTVTAVTVDHGLRDGSAAEAAQVAAFCDRAGIAHHTLRWQGPKATGNLMDQARHARFCLIAEFAKAHDIGHVFLGHTADDNAESFLMNLARQSGINGLSGMRTDWQDHGVAWHRPILAATRADLRAYLTRNGVAWIDDPSNDNDRFTRVKARKAMRALAPLGITVETLCVTISNLADAQQALQHATAKVAQDHVYERAGALTLSAQTFAQLDSEISRRLLSGIIGWMGAAAYAPRGTQLFGLQMALASKDTCQLGGVGFCLSSSGIEITREPRAVQGAVPLGDVWDHRWRVTGPADPNFEVRALGAAGLRQCPDWRDHGSRAVLVVTPAVWAQDRVVAAPLAGNPGQYRAELTQPLVQFILSH